MLRASVFELLQLCMLLYWIDKTLSPKHIGIGNIPSAVRYDLPLWAKNTWLSYPTTFNNAKCANLWKKIGICLDVVRSPLLVFWCHF